MFMNANFENISLHNFIDELVPWEAKIINQFLHNVVAVNILNEAGDNVRRENPQVKV